MFQGRKRVDGKTRGTGAARRVGMRSLHDFHGINLTDKSQRFFDGERPQDQYS
jgi:hypothetical protein